MASKVKSWKTWKVPKTPTPPARDLAAEARASRLRTLVMLGVSRGLSAEQIVTEETHRDLATVQAALASCGNDAVATIILLKPAIKRPDKPWHVHLKK